MNVAPITVLMPVFNAEKYLHEAIESILNQTFNNFEFLIINDGSTDNSEKIILNYSDPRIRYIKNEKNLRLITTLNNGIELARGKYLARMDADDISDIHRLQIQFDYMEQHPDVAVCGTWYKIFGKKNQTVKYSSGHNQIMLKMLYQCHLSHPSLMLRVNVLRSFEKKFDPEFLHAEDYDFFVRIGEKFKLANIPRVLLHYRHHAASVSFANKQIQVSNSMRVKKNLFAKIGIIVTDADIDLFKKILQHEYDINEQFLLNSKSMIENLIKANNRSSFFNKEFFNKELSKIWFHVCYNLSSLGSAAVNTYLSSSASEYYHMRLAERFKFFIKTL